MPARTDPDADVAPPDHDDPTGRPRFAAAAAAGVAAAAAGLGAGELVAAVFEATASPLLSVGGLVIDLTPAFLKQAVITAFGFGDKVFLIVVLLAVLLALGAIAGLARARRPALGLLLVAVAGFVAATAAVTRSGASPLSAAPAVVAAVVGAAVLARLLPAGATADASAVRSGRRLFVGAAVWAVVGVAAGAAARTITAGSRTVQSAIERIRLPKAAVAAPAITAADSFAVQGLTPLVTATSDFYRVDISLAPPSVDPDTWSLSITGEVERPVSITYRELAAMPMTASWTTLMCVSNEVGGDLNGTALWLGAPIRTLLAKAAPKAGADMVLSTGADGFTASTPLSVLQDPDRDCLLAIGMNGDPLPQLHGFPVRMVVPGLYGYVSATKWLTKLEVTRFDRATAYWTDRGYSAQAPVKLSSRIDVPTTGAPAGIVTVAGVAWAQHVGIARVQLQIDSGPWRDCELSEQVTPDIWRQWRYRWTAPKGAHVLRVRATDAHGLVQTAKVADEIPNGATGLHTVRVQIA